MTGDSAALSDRAERSSEPLIWVVRLWASQPSRRWTVLVFALLAAVIGYLLLQNVVAAFVGFAAVMLSTAEFWLPLRFKLDESGASSRCGISETAIEWANIKRAVLSVEGIKLSPHEVEKATSPFRGVFLRFAGNREQVVEAVRKRVNEDVRFVEPGADRAGD